MILTNKQKTQINKIESEATDFILDAKTNYTDKDVSYYSYLMNFLFLKIAGLEDEIKELKCENKRY